MSVSQATTPSPTAPTVTATVPNQYLYEQPHRHPYARVTAPGPGHRPSPAPGPGAVHDTVGEVVRWAAFSCALVPAVLLVYGTSFGAAATTALGLAAVTAACRVLLRRSERTPVPLAPPPPATSAGHARGAAPVPHRGRHSRTGSGAHRGGR